MEYFAGEWAWPEVREELGENGNTSAMEHEVERERRGMGEMSMHVRLYSLEGFVATGVSSSGGGLCFLHYARLVERARQGFARRGARGELA